MTDWLKEVKKHHRAIKRCFETAIADPSLDNVSELQFLIDGHSYAEESVIYPELSKDGLDDEQLEKEQTEAKGIIHSLVINYKETKSHRMYLVAKLNALMAAVLEHALVHEEQEKFKELHQDLSDKQNELLGEQYMSKYNEWIT